MMMLDSLFARARFQTYRGNSFSRRLALLLAAGCVGIGSQAAMAADADKYPAHLIQMIIPFSPGGPADIVGRLYAERLSKLAGQPVVVENKAGASGIIGTQAAVRSNPDGYTILFGTTSTFAVNPVVMKNLPYDFFRDLSLIGLVANAPHVLVVRKDLPAKNIKELIALAKAHPGKYTFSSAGTGTIIHMANELPKLRLGLDLLHVPYKGGAPATMAVLSGEADMTVNDLSVLLPHIKDGKIRALAAASKERLQPLPDVPTFAELGYPGIVSSTWWGIAVPSRTPDDIKAKLGAMHSKIIADPDYVARLAKLAIEPLDLTPQQSQAFIEGEIESWRKVAAEAKIHLD